VNAEVAKEECARIVGGVLDGDPPAQGEVTRAALTAYAGPEVVAYARARSETVRLRRPAVVVCRTSPSDWTESGAWWEVGVPAGLSGRASYEEQKAAQLRWVTGSRERP
jgi:hypothetical protein